MKLEHLLAHLKVGLCYLLCLFFAVSQATANTERTSKYDFILSPWVNAYILTNKLFYCNNLQKVAYTKVMTQMESETQSSFSYHDMDEQRSIFVHEASIFLYCILENRIDLQ